MYKRQPVPSNRSSQKGISNFLSITQHRPNACGSSCTIAKHALHLRTSYRPHPGRVPVPMFRYADETSAIIISAEDSHTIGNTRFNTDSSCVTAMSNHTSAASASSTPAAGVLTFSTALNQTSSCTSAVPCVLLVAASLPDAPRWSWVAVGSGDVIRPG